MKTALRTASAAVLLAAALAAAVLTASMLTAGCGKMPGIFRDPKLIEQAYETAADINGSSDFGGHCRLLECPDDSPRAALCYFIADSPDDAYYYFTFDGKTLVSQINLSSPEYSLCGIRPGDGLSASEDVLTAKGFVKSSDGRREKDGAVYAVYDRGYISVTLSGDGGTVTGIIISALDPEQEWITY